MHWNRDFRPLQSIYKTNSLTVLPIAQILEGVMTCGHSLKLNKRERRTSLRAGQCTWFTHEQHLKLFDWIFCFCPICQQFQESSW